jgi:hypothetical protein
MASSLWPHAKGCAHQLDASLTLLFGGERRTSGTHVGNDGSVSAKEITRTALLAFGYPVSIAVIARFVPVVREQRTAWFVAHEVAVAAIVAGWAIDGDTRAVAINGTWLVAAAVWYALGGRRGRRAT